MALALDSGQNCGEERVHAAGVNPLAPDVGTSPQDMATIGQHTSAVPPAGRGRQQNKLAL
jgi:hypothetical protein